MKGATNIKVMTHLNANMENLKNILFFFFFFAHTGQFKDRKRDGKGIYRFANGDVYEGEFRQAEFHGQGKLIYHDGSKYIGNIPFKVLSAQTNNSLDNIRQVCKGRDGRHACLS